MVAQPGEQSMDQLWVTFLDVGWGDSILLEVEDAAGRRRFALVDSNDTSNLPSTLIFLKRHLERYADRAGLKHLPYPLFDFVLATHAHADHVAGLQGVIREYGTDLLYSPRFDGKKNPVMATLIRWAATRTRKNVRVANQHKYLSFPMTFDFGSASVGVLWPPPPFAGSKLPHDSSNENNNSLVLSLRLLGISMVLTGDCEADNWVKSADNTWPIPLPQAQLKLVQLPHHGARNGLLVGSTDEAPLFAQIVEKNQADPSVNPLLAVSCHPKPHRHPHPHVKRRLGSLPFPAWITGSPCVRTDSHRDFTIWTDGIGVQLFSRPAL
jgi:beta-lactamase superfamily II metal-dependent hydrolase